MFKAPTLLLLAVLAPLHVSPGSPVLPPAKARVEVKVLACANPNEAERLNELAEDSKYLHDQLWDAELTEGRKKMVPVSTSKRIFQRGSMKTEEQAGLELKAQKDHLLLMVGWEVATKDRGNTTGLEQHSFMVPLVKGQWTITPLRTGDKKGRALYLAARLE